MNRTKDLKDIVYESRDGGDNSSLDQMAYNTEKVGGATYGSKPQSSDLRNNFKKLQELNSNDKSVIEQ